MLGVSATHKHAKRLLVLIQDTRIVRNNLSFYLPNNRFN